MPQTNEARNIDYPIVPGIENISIKGGRVSGYRKRALTPSDIETLFSIKESVAGGHDVEVRGTPDGGLKVLEITRKNISAR